uniref:Uncharacterized protein n=1 Tax=Hyaloperonospora arabidopsidis (strain Emoy2) TaxID=559515 RepID=M4B2T9_HYAAE
MRRFTVISKLSKSLACESKRAFDVFARVGAVRRIHVFLETAKNAAGAADRFQQIRAALIGCVWLLHGQLSQRVVDVKFRGLLPRVTGHEPKN